MPLRKNANSRFIKSANAPSFQQSITHINLPTQSSQSYKQKKKKTNKKMKSPKIWSVCFISINGHWRNISMLRKIIHINKPYVGDMSWLLIDYTDISLSITLRQRKTYLYIRQQTPLHQILFNIFTTSKICLKSETES